MKVRLSLISILFFYTCSAQQLFTLAGKVSDKSSVPIAGASIYLFNTNRGTVSDNQGNFILKNLLPGKYTIQFSAVGYATVNLDFSTEAISKELLNIQLTDALIQLDAVVVSAEKKEEALQNTPLSISAISSQQVRQYRLWSSDELTTIVPNLYSSNSGDDRNVTSIRGITTTSYDPAIATYIDGVNQFGLDTYISQLLDIERIEVLRGPQGTLYGRNAMGGVINIITKQPSNYTNGFAEISVGNYGQQRYSVGLRTPLVKNKLYAGASLLYRKTDGFYTNDFKNENFDKQNIFTGNYYIKFIANEKWTLSLNAKHNNNRNNGAFPLVNLFAADPFDPPYIVSQDATAKMIDNTFNSSFTANYAGKAFNFSSQDSLSIQSSLL